MPAEPEFGRVTVVGPWLARTRVRGVPGLPAFVSVTFGLLTWTTWLLVPVT